VTSHHGPTASTPLKPVVGRLHPLAGHTPAFIAEEGRMQDVALWEAEIAERVRRLRKGMTVAEAVDVMESPDGVSMIGEETTIKVPLPHGVFKDAVDRPESGYEVQITLVPGSLEDALEHPELVCQLIYTPYEQQKNHPDLAGNVNTGPPPGTYKVFVPAVLTLGSSSCAGCGHPAHMLLNPAVL
jgi:hypothetical protein